MTDDPQRLHDRLQAADIATDERYIRCEKGEKRSLDHDTRLSEPPAQNYGVYATAADNLVLVDIDDYGDVDDETGLNAVRALQDTLTVETPHGGTHRYYYVETDDDGRLPAAAMLDRFDVKNPAPSWGEVRAANQYVVGPGSQLAGCDKDGCETCATDDGGRYRITDDREIATISAEAFCAALAADPSFKDDERGDSGDSGEASGQTAAAPDDADERLQTALEKDEKLARLWRGDASDYSGDRSRAECALAQKLGWWFGNHKPTVRRLMDQSGAEKWAERTDEGYRSSVLEAVDRNTDCYDPGRSQRPPQTASDGGTPVAAGEGSDPGGPDGTREWDHVRSLYTAADDAQERGRARYEASEAVLQRHEFVNVRESDALYMYDTDDGIYRDRAEREVRTLTREGLQTHFRRSEVNELLEHIRAVSTEPYSELGGPADHIATKNGVVHIDGGSRALVDHSPDYRFLHRLPVEYDPSADCPKWREFLKDSVNKGSERDKLQEYVGYALYHWGLPHHKALFIVGPQASGKSTFLDTVRELLGEEGVSHLTPQQMVERFGGAELFGKWANIRSDIPSSLIRDTGQFKEIVAGDPIKAEKKNEDPFMFRPDAKHFYSANTLPDTDDADDAFFRRILLVAFPSSVPVDERDKKLGQKLHDELPGILNWALDGLERLQQQGGFTGDRTPGATADTWKKWGSTADRFASVCLEIGDIDKPTPKSEVYRRYIRFCEAENMPAEPQRVFTSRLKTEHGVTDGRATIGGRQRRCFLNVQYTHRAESYAGSDQDDDRDGRDTGLGDY